MQMDWDGILNWSVYFTVQVSYIGDFSTIAVP